MIIAVERLIVSDHIEFYWEVCFEEGAHDFDFASRLIFNAREAPRWPISNFFKVHFCLAFLFYNSLVLFYDIFLQNASVFLDFFCILWDNSSFPQLWNSPLLISRT